MVSFINQAVIKQLRLRIEVDSSQYPGKKKLKLKGKELECIPAEVFLLNNDIEILDLSPEREACLYYHLDEVRCCFILKTATYFKENCLISKQ